MNRLIYGVCGCLLALLSLAGCGALPASPTPVPAATQVLVSSPSEATSGPPGMPPGPPTLAIPPVATLLPTVTPGPPTIPPIVLTQNAERAVLATQVAATAQAAPTGGGRVRTATPAPLLPPTGTSVPAPASATRTARSSPTPTRTLRPRSPTPTPSVAPDDAAWVQNYLLPRYRSIAGHTMQFQNVALIPEVVSGPDAVLLVFFDVTDAEATYLRAQISLPTLRAWSRSVLDELKAHWPGRFVIVTLGHTYSLDHYVPDTGCLSVGPADAGPSWAITEVLVSGVYNAQGYDEAGVCTYATPTPIPAPRTPRAPPTRPSTPTSAPLPPTATPIPTRVLDDVITFASDQPITVTGPQVAVIVDLTNKDSVAHTLEVQARFYRVPLDQLGADPSMQLVAAGALRVILLQPGETRAVRIKATNKTGDPIVSVAFSATGN